MHARGGRATHAQLQTTSYTLHPLHIHSVANYLIHHPSTSYNTYNTAKEMREGRGVNYVFESKGEGTCTYNFIHTHPANLHTSTCTTYMGRGINKDKRAHTWSCSEISVSKRGRGDTCTCNLIDTHPPTQLISAQAHIQHMVWQ